MWFYSTITLLVADLKYLQKKNSARYSQIVEPTRPTSVISPIAIYTHCHVNGRVQGNKTHIPAIATTVIVMVKQHLSLYILRESMKWGLRIPSLSKRNIGTNELSGFAQPLQQLVHFPRIDT